MCALVGCSAMWACNVVFWPGSVHVPNVLDVFRTFQTFRTFSPSACSEREPISVCLRFLIPARPPRLPLARGLPCGHALAAGMTCFSSRCVLAAGIGRLAPWCPMGAQGATIPPTPPIISYSAIPLQGVP